MPRPSDPRARQDRIAWETIKTAKVYTGPPLGLARSGRPRNYVELAELAEHKDYEHAWSEFLHEFFRYRTAEFFAVPPPRSFSPQRRALLAGVAEFLSADFGLPIPAWVNEPEYFLDEQWDPWEDICPAMEEFRQVRIDRSHPVFLKRNIVYETRNLITL